MSTTSRSPKPSSGPRSSLGWVAAVVAVAAGLSPSTLADDLRVPTRALPAYEPGSAAARLLSEGHWEPALRLAEEAFHKRPHDPRSFSLLGECLWRAGHLARAQMLFERGIELDPTDGRLLAGSTRAHLAAGRLVEAIDTSRRATRVDSEQPWSWVAHASSFAQSGQLDKAREALARARELMEGRPGSATEAARLRQAAHDVESIASRLVVVDSEHHRGRGELRIESGFPLVDVEVAGEDGESHTIPMLVDTGGSVAVVLDASLRHVVDHSITGRRRVAGFQRPTTAEFGSLARLELGEWRFDELPVLFMALLDDARVEPQSLPYRGIIGPVLTQDRVLVLNLRRGGVAVEESDPETVSPRQLSDGEIRCHFSVLGDGKVLVPVMVGSEPVLALLDTGALQSRRSQRLQRKGHWGPVQIGGVARRTPRPPAQPILDQLVSPNLGVEVSLLLGMDFLMRYGIVTLDYPHRTLTLTPRDERRR